MSPVLLKPSVLRSWRISRSVGAVLTLTKNCKKYKTRGGETRRSPLLRLLLLYPMQLHLKSLHKLHLHNQNLSYLITKAHQTLKTKTTLNPKISSGGHLGKKGLLIGMIILPT
ncbi:hypothetical protein Hanom_Chr00s074511g01790421 [Helianthus anomalus]